MTIQIALRLPEAVVEYIDAQVLAGRAKSRSEVVARFVERDRRRERAAHDVEKILADRSVTPAVDLNALATLAAATPLDLD
jgi:Arc/MetJ-type ribon-helix-helix transcriptional regulator